MMYRLGRGLRLGDISHKWAFYYMISYNSEKLTENMIAQTHHTIAHHTITNLCAVPDPPPRPHPHGGDPLSRVAVWRRTHHPALQEARGLNGFHDPRYPPGPLSLCWQCRLLQQSGLCESSVVFVVSLDFRCFFCLSPHH